MLSYLLPIVVLIAPDPGAQLADNLSLGPACDANETGRLWRQVRVEQTSVAMLFLQPDCVPSPVWNGLLLVDGEVLAFVSRRIIARAHSVDIPNIRRERQRMRQIKAVRAAVAGVGGDLDAVPPPVEDPELAEASRLGGMRLGVIFGLVDVACAALKQPADPVASPRLTTFEGRPVSKDGLAAMCGLAPVVQTLNAEVEGLGGAQGGASDRRASAAAGQ